MESIGTTSRVCLLQRNECNYSAELNSLYVAMGKCCIQWAFRTNFEIMPIKSPVSASCLCTKLESRSELRETRVLPFWTQQIWIGPSERFVANFISGGRPEASKRNQNFQSATWDSSIGPGGSRMVSPPVHFPKLILWLPLSNEYPLWGSPECKYMHILLTHADVPTTMKTFKSRRCVLLEQQHSHIYIYIFIYFYFYFFCPNVFPG